MNAREKKLLSLVIGMAALAVAIGLVYLAMIRPLKSADSQTRALRDQLDKIRQERRAFFKAETDLQNISKRTFSDRPDLTSARSSELLTKLILLSGLPETDVTRLPLGPRKIRGAQEIGWLIQAHGPLVQLVNLVYLLENVPQIHRTENLTISPGSSPDQAKISLRWLTLIIDPAPDVEFNTLPFTTSLDGQDRHSYDIITSRDLFHPYEPPAPAASEAAPTGPPPPGPETFRVVSLSEWKGQQEIHVRDLTSQTTQTHRPGDPLAGGTILMIDYRPFPKPGKEHLKSNSRVIIGIDTAFWAIEEGDTLADIYQLTSEKIPADVVKK